MRYLSLAFCLAIVLAVADQVRAAGKHTAAEHKGYEKAIARSIAENKPLVVAVDCTCPEGEWIVYHMSDRALFRMQGQGLVISRPKDGASWWLATLPAKATAKAIRAVLAQPPGCCCGANCTCPGCIGGSSCGCCSPARRPVR